MISSMGVLAPHGEVSKAFTVARLATHKLLVSVDDVVGLELLATTLAVADKHMATVLPQQTLKGHQIICNVGFLCLSMMRLFNFLLVERTLKQDLQRKETSGKRDQGRGGG